MALAHQGAEFLLKAQITRVSPFLLISGDLSKWPAHRNSISKSFADFRTVDAQDLPRLHDGVCPSPMPDVFRDRFEELRKLRNTVMHSVDTSRPFTVHDGVVAVLEISDALFGATSWHKRRKAYVDGQVNHWDPFGYSDFNPAYPFAKETLHVVDEILEPAQVIQFYGFDPKQRRYICRGCEETHADDRIRSCLLTPKGAATTTIVCFCCFESFKVVRRDCTVGKCKGNVLDPDDYGYCLTCGEYPEDFKEDEE